MHRDLRPGFPFERKREFLGSVEKRFKRMSAAYDVHVGRAQKGRRLEVGRQVDRGKDREVKIAFAKTADCRLFVGEHGEPGPRRNGTKFRHDRFERDEDRVVKAGDVEHAVELGGLKDALFAKRPEGFEQGLRALGDRDRAVRGQKTAPVSLEERVRKHGAGLGEEAACLRFGNAEAKGGAPEMTMIDGDDEEGEEFLGDARVLQISNHG